jgi:hypothetical protein
MLLAIVLIFGCGGKGLHPSSTKDAAPGMNEGADAAAVADQVGVDELQAVDTTWLDGGTGGSRETDGGTTDVPIGNGGASGDDGPVGNGGAGGTMEAGGTSGFGGSPGAGGLPSSGATQASGGVPSSGGAPGTGGLPGTDAPIGGAAGTGGVPGAGGTPGSGGLPATGVSVATGGASGTGGTTLLCSVGPPPTEGTSHCDSNATDSYGSYQWSLFQNGTAGCLTTYANADAAFSATWNNSGDFLARVGLEWDGTTTYDQLGTITAQFAETKRGTDGGYSYIGIYGLSVSPCVEFYIVEDSLSAMPIRPYGGNKIGAAVIDGATYTFYTGPMTGAATAFCPAAHTQPWKQMWSVRETARQCGQISITDHFNEWRKIGITVGSMVEAVLVVETLGGSGRVDFTTGSMTAQ